MKLLVVDNHSRYIKNLERILSDYNTKVTNFSNLSLDEIKNVDGVILSGGNRYSVIKDNEKFTKEIEIIKHSNIPIFGICLGFQLICYSYGEKIEPIGKRIIGKREVTKIKKDYIFDDLDQLFVYQNHKFGVNYVKNLIPLARSKECVEVIKHPNKPIYGVQFHPEITSSDLNGCNIIYNFLNSIRQ